MVEEGCPALFSSFAFFCLVAVSLGFGCMCEMIPREISRCVDALSQSALSCAMPRVFMVPTWVRTAEGGCFARQRCHRQRGMSLWDCRSGTRGASQDLGTGVCSAESMEARFSLVNYAPEGSFKAFSRRSQLLWMIEHYVLKISLRYFQCEEL